MDKTGLYLSLANATILFHLLVVAFVVFGLVLILAGNLLHWKWVNAWWFRLTHLATILIVVAEVWLDVTCPLTTLEMWLRAQAGVAVHEAGFIEYWLQRLLYYQAPPWVFTLGYTSFGLLVLLFWRIFPPVGSSRRGSHE